MRELHRYQLVTCTTEIVFQWHYFRDSKRTTARILSLYFSFSGHLLPSQSKV